MARQFGPYGMIPLDSFTSSLSRSSVSIDIEPSGQARSDIVCVSGTICNTTDGKVLYGRLGDGSNVATHRSTYWTPFNTSAYTYTGGVFRMSRYNTGNSGATTSAGGERTNFIVWIVTNESTSAPIVNNMVYVWSSPDYTSSTYNNLNTWTVAQVITANRSEEINFYYYSSSITACRLKSWGLAGD